MNKQKYNFHKPGSEGWHKWRQLQTKNRIPDEVIEKRHGKDFLKAYKAHFKLASVDKAFYTYHKYAVAGEHNIGKPQIKTLNKLVDMVPYSKLKNPALRKKVKERLAPSI